MPKVRRSRYARPLGYVSMNSRFTLPDAVAHEISLKAAKYVRRAAPVRAVYWPGESPSRNLIRATWRKGKIGVHFPERANHLWMLDQGIRPFTMWSLEGKTVPLRLPNGAVIYRVASRVGQPKIVKRDEYGRIAPGGVKTRWRHPGVKPMGYIIPSVRRAVRDWFNENPDRAREAFGLPRRGLRIRKDD